MKLATLLPELPVAKTFPGLLSIQTATDEALVVDQETVDEQVVWPMAILQGLREALIDPDGAGVGVGVLVKVGVGVRVFVGVGVLVLVGVGVLVLVGVGVRVLVGGGEVGVAGAGPQQLAGEQLVKAHCPVAQIVLCGGFAHTKQSQAPQSPELQMLALKQVDPVSVQGAL